MLQTALLVLTLAAADTPRTPAAQPATPPIPTAAAAAPAFRWEAPPVPAALRVPAAAQPPIEYSDAYATRLAIHRYASFATVPLFIAQYLAGDELLDDDDGGEDVEASSSDDGSDWAESWHPALGAAVGTLFVVNTVTGGWNLWEGRKDPAGRRWRTAHGVLMMLANAGFVATFVTANSVEDDAGGADTHRAVAVSSMGVALASYLMMLPPFRRD